MKNKYFLSLVLSMVCCNLMAYEVDWLQYTIKIDGYEFKIKLPPRESLSFPRFEIVDNISLCDPELDEEEHSITAIKKAWDFPGGLLHGSSGSIDLRVRVGKVDRLFNGDLMDSDAYDRWVLTRWGESILDVFVVDLEVTPINGTFWKHYKVKGEMEFVVCERPLTAEHYIQIITRYVSNRSENSWPAHASALVESIFGTIELDIRGEKN